MLALVAKANNQLKITQSNESYKLNAKRQCKKLESNEGDYVICPERFLNHCFQKCITRAFNPYCILNVLFPMHI